ncbi:MAG: prepilin peptidase, partial [Nitrososphaerota archaeon]|nr:prepilin peptidase [Nitrososphaerota archaeon]
MQLLMMWIPFVFTLSVLTYASVFDLKKRKVSNWVWLFAYPIGCIMALTKLAVSLLDVQAVFVSLGVSMVLGFVLFCSGFYGGADVKALVFMGLTVPTIPHTFNMTLGFSALPVVLAVFCISTILSLIWPLSIFTLNLKDLLIKKVSMFDGIKLTIRQKVLLLFTARYISLTQLESLRYFPAETVVLQEKNGEPTRKLLHFVKAETNLQKCLDK